HKLKRVLWIPVEGERSIPLAQRRVIFFRILHTPGAPAHVC
ncbi:MutH/Sau3AI family endonuclease, partial [Escherichia coli]